MIADSENQPTAVRIVTQNAENPSSVNQLGRLDAVRFDLGADEQAMAALDRFFAEHAHHQELAPEDVLKFTQAAEHAQSLARVLLDLLADVKANVCLPIVALNGKPLTAVGCQRELVGLIRRSTEALERIDFALAAHAGIAIGTGSEVHP